MVLPLIPATMCSQFEAVVAVNVRKQLHSAECWHPQGNPEHRIVTGEAHEKIHYAQHRERQGGVEEAIIAYPVQQPAGEDSTPLCVWGEAVHKGGRPSLVVLGSDATLGSTSDMNGVSEACLDRASPQGDEDHDGYYQMTM